MSTVPLSLLVPLPDLMKQAAIKLTGMSGCAQLAAQLTQASGQMAYYVNYALEITPPVEITNAQD